MLESEGQFIRSCFLARRLRIEIGSNMVAKCTLELSMRNNGDEY